MALHGLARRVGLRRAARGYTLIELAALTVIVGLLLAIVQPSLRAALGDSRNATCLDRLRQIATASRVYADQDPNGWGIPVHPKQFQQCPPGEYCPDQQFIGAYEWGGKSGIGQDDWLTGYPGDPLNSKYGTKAGFGPATRPLNRILYPHGFRENLAPAFDEDGAKRDTQLELQAFRCPADTGPPRGAHCEDWLQFRERPSNDHFGNSYAANILMIAVSAGEMRTNSPYLRPLSRVPNPTRTLFYEENIGRWAWACRREIADCLWIGLGVDVGPSKRLDGWHGKAWNFNRAFGDMHAEKQTIFVEGTMDEEGYAEHYRTETVYPPDDPRNTPHRCIIIRGDGWQKDTLPADLIGTGLLHTGNGRPSYEGCVTSDTAGDVSAAGQGR